jgi:hypothetical protein
VLANPVFGSFVQDLHEGPVPVRYRRTFDGPGGSPIPANAPATAVPTLPLVTIDEAVPGVDDPTAYTFGEHPWNPVAPPPPDTATPPPNLPTQFGVDMQYQRGGAGPATRRRASLCIGQKEVNIRALPTAIDQPGFHLDLGTQFPGANMLHGPASFAARYVRPHINHLDKVEAANLFAAGLAVCSIWQTGRVFVRGTADGTDAFTEAEAIGQPPHTPVYFAVDISVDDPLDPNTVPLQQIVDYFSDVRRGYRLYLAGGGTTPYYVGAYAAANVLDAVYRAGLATHFWQPWPPTWGPPVPRPANWDNIAPGWRAWPHLNLWQVLLVNGQQAANNDNQALMACVPGGAQGGLDCNVAWGDPGSWFPRDPNIWTQP